MAIQKSVAVRNAQLDQIETTVGTAAVLKFFTGAMPASCSVADAGTLLASMTLPSDWMNAASGGTKTKLGTWSTTGAAVGNAGYWRLYASDGTTCHMQGLCGMNWAASTVVALGLQMINDTGKLYKCITAGTTASSGGPTGTSSDITDGTVHWQYIGTADVTMDNDNIAVSQAFSATVFTITAGGA